mgnify:CR=1 FL=1
MFYWLTEFAGTIPGINVFRYITFRTGGAMVTGALFANAPYQQVADARARLLAYIDFRATLAQGELPEITCLLGTLALWFVASLALMTWRAIEAQPLSTLLLYLVSEIGVPMLFIAALCLGGATRAIAPWLLPLMLVLVWASIAGVDLLAWIVASRSDWLKALPGWLNAYVVMLLFIVAPWLVAWWPARQLGRALGAAYTRKWLSELIVLFTAVWGIVLLMRALDVPARVVTGYQGGEWNPIGAYFIVRQSDAHAWVEAWLDGYWTRIDPTAAVAPDRVERGLQEALPETERLLVSASSWLSFTGFNVLWEEANFAYTKWVIGFDRDRQRELLKDLGLGGMSPFTALGWMLLAITASGALMGTAWWFWLARQERQLDPWLRAWRQLRKRLIAAGLPVENRHTVSTAMTMAAQRWPEHADTFAAFATGYNAARFAEKIGPDSSRPKVITAIPYAWRLRRAAARSI